MIILPKKQVLLPKKMALGMKGFLRFQVWRPDDVLNRCRIDTGFFPNKILDNGRNNMYTQTSWLTWCRVGTGNVAPTALDTQLQAQVASSNLIPFTSHSTQGSAPYFGWKRNTYRFNVGAGHGGQNLNEAGIGWGSTGSTLISRARVTPLADEVLDVTYELRYYPPLSDALNSVVLNGVTYDTISRAVAVTTDRWSQNIGQRIGEYSPVNSSWSAWNGALGAITAASPGGTSAALDNNAQYIESYVGNSYQIVMVAQCGINGWNVASGIRCLNITTTAGAYQTQFSSNPGGLSVPKTSSFTMQTKFVLGWQGMNLSSEWQMISASDVTTPAAGEWNTNVANTVLRINWDDLATEDQRTALQAASGTVFRVTKSSVPNTWVEYTVTGAYTEFGSWTEYPVSQTGISGGGPVAGDTTLIKNLDD